MEDFMCARICDNLQLELHKDVLRAIIEHPFGRLSRGRGQVLHVLLSRSPLASARGQVPFDLHVLGAPPAFILSQDRTLRPNILGFEPVRSSQLLR